MLLLWLAIAFLLGVVTTVVVGRLSGSLSAEVAAWATAAGTIFLGAVALFQRRFESWLCRPRLDASIRLGPPDCHQIPLGTAQGPVTGYYFRLRVQNRGRATAENVEVRAASLEEQSGDGSFSPARWFLPMNLVWSHGRGLFVTITPEMDSHCDLGHMLDPRSTPPRPAVVLQGRSFPAGKAMLALDVETKPNTMSHLVPPGRWRLTVHIAAANAKRIEKIVQISFDGSWDEDEERMLSKNIRLVME